MQITVLVSTPGPNSDVGMLDWRPSDDSEAVEMLREHYRDVSVDGDVVKEYSEDVSVDWSSRQIGEFLYEKYLAD